MLTRWDKMKAVQRMQDFIEAHLEEPVTMAGLAGAARYSQWNAARMFKELTGKSPFEYLRLRRLSCAATRLLGTPCRVVDVAFDFTFDSHEGFTRAFARHFGMSPRHFRRDGDTAGLFLPWRLRDWYHLRQKGAVPMSDSKPVTIFVQVLDRPARKLILKRGQRATHYFEYCEEVGCGIWDQLAAIPGALHEPMGLWLPAHLQLEGTSHYVQGVEMPLDYAGAVPEGFEVIELPPAKLMVFQGPPFEDLDFEAAITQVWDAINAYNPETCGFAWADQDAPRFQLSPLGYRGYIEGRPVRPMQS